MATFVLVHGGWQGGWSWRRVVPHLRADGHEVFTLTLTGLGERARTYYHVRVQPGHRARTFSEYSNMRIWKKWCSSVIATLGLVITSVAEVVAEKLSHLVYLDAWVPTDGQGMFDLMPPERRDGYREAARGSGEGIGITVGC